MFKNHSSYIHNLEVQIGEIANALTSRNQGDFPSNTETNPREQLKAITLRSGKKLQQPMESNSSKQEKDTIEENSREAVNKEGLKGAKERRERVYEPPIPFP